MLFEFNREIDLFTWNDYSLLMFSVYFRMNLNHFLSAQLDVYKKNEMK